MNSSKLNKLRVVLRYELWMIRDLGAILQTDRSAHKDGLGINESICLNNALLESLLLHCRQVMWFFNPRSDPKADDLVAIDYVESWKSPANYTKHDWRRLNKHLAHMTKERCSLSEDDKNWALSDLIPPLEKNAQKFFKDTDLRHEQSEAFWNLENLRTAAPAFQSPKDPTLDIFSTSGNRSGVVIPDGT